MSTGDDRSDRRFLARWVRATLVGWLLGFVLIILAALVSSTIGIGESQSLIGVGMGAGVGYMQGLVARRWLAEIRPWVLSSIVGMGAPFVLSDLAATIWSGYSYSLPLCVAMGGLFAGLLQRRILRSHSRRANWWIISCVAGWSAAVGPIVLLDAIDLPRGPWSLFIFLAAMLFGAIVFSVVTGRVWSWMFGVRRTSGLTTG